MESKKGTNSRTARERLEQLLHNIASDLDQVNQILKWHPCHMHWVHITKLHQSLIEVRRLSKTLARETGQEEKGKK